MLHSLRQLSTNFLRRPIGASALVALVAVVTLLVQTQVWGIAERLLLAAVPASIPGIVVFVLHPRSGRFSGKSWSIAAIAFGLWILLLADIGWPFLSWFLVFGAAAVLLMLLSLPLARALTVGMILFAGFYLTLRLHQITQMGYLQLRIALQARAEEARIAARIEGEEFRLERDGRALLLGVRPGRLSVRGSDLETGFPGLHPLILFSSNPADDRAIPLLAVLAVPPAFPPRLWNMQLESTLAALRREGRIGEPKAAERKGTCGDLACNEFLWIYEDRFHARSVQTGYALIPLRVPGAQSNPDGLDSPNGEAVTIMLWFREPFVEGLPHGPDVLDFLKGLRRSPGAPGPKPAAPPLSPQR